MLRQMYEIAVKKSIPLKARPMRPSLKWPVLGLLAVAALAWPVRADDHAIPSRLAPAVEDGPFLRPADGGDAEPRWGIVGGLSVGLWPCPGPRGLIRVYTPYLGQPALTPLNFIAVEPIAGGRRGLSELEKSRFDGGRPGKAMWSADRLDASGPIAPRKPWRPARGVTGTEQGHAILSVFVHVEPFDNGARPIVEVRFRADRPHEVTFRVDAGQGGAPMKSCILSATMGNYARLRRLSLRSRTVDARTLYEPFRPVFAGFAAHREWSLDQLLVRTGHALVAATSDEADPASARYDPDVVSGWHYQGKPGTQYWRSRAVPSLVARVNARRTYWASEARIPGGVAFENFELEAPFEPGQEFTFGAILGSPAQLGFSP